MEISKMTQKDLENISDILEIEFDDFWNYNILRSELLNAMKVYSCCLVNSDIVGFGGFSIILDTAELNNIVIKKSQRGNGYSKVLLKRLIKLAKIHGCKKMNLEVAANNAIAIHLYKECGFKQVGLRPKYYNGTDALLYTLDF